MKSYPIKSYSGGEYFESILLLSKINGKVELTYKSGNIAISVTEDYPFLALEKLRRELELLNVKLMCNGARLDVYPSSALIIGVKAYQLEFGKPATKDSLCNIFDPIDNVDKVATVDEQRAYWLKWLNDAKLRWK
jgi:hypothetical protein